MSALTLKADIPQFKWLLTSGQVRLTEAEGHYDTLSDAYSSKSRVAAPHLFSRLPVEVLFVCLRIRFGSMHGTVSMVRRRVKRIELHRA